VEYVERGWYFIGIESSQVVSMHRRVFELLQDLLKPGIIRDRLSFDMYLPEEKDSFLRYGYRYTPNAYKPHITLGRTRSMTTIPRNELLESITKRILPHRLLFDEVVVFEIGQNGTLRRKLHSEKLI